MNGQISQQDRMTRAVTRGLARAGLPEDAAEDILRFVMPAVGEQIAQHRHGNHLQPEQWDLLVEAIDGLRPEVDGREGEALDGIMSKLEAAGLRPQVEPR